MTLSLNYNPITNFIISNILLLFPLLSLCSIDATFGEGKGRYINDSAPKDRSCNSKMRKVTRNNEVQLHLFASRDITAHEEIRYSYDDSGEGTPWRCIDASSDNPPTAVVDTTNPLDKDDLSSEAAIHDDHRQNIASSVLSTYVPSATQDESSAEYVSNDNILTAVIDTTNPLDEDDLSSEAAIHDDHRQNIESSLSTTYVPSTTQDESSAEYVSNDNYPTAVIDTTNPRDKDDLSSEAAIHDDHRQNNESLSTTTTYVPSTTQEESSAEYVSNDNYPTAVIDTTNPRDKDDLSSEAAIHDDHRQNNGSLSTTTTYVPSTTQDESSAEYVSNDNYPTAAVIDTTNPKDKDDLPSEAAIHDDHRQNIASSVSSTCVPSATQDESSAEYVSNDNILTAVIDTTNPLDEDDLSSEAAIHDDHRQNIASYVSSTCVPSAAQDESSAEYVSNDNCPTAVKDTTNPLDEDDLSPEAAIHDDHRQNIASSVSSTCVPSAAQDESSAECVSNDNYPTAVEDTTNPLDEDDHQKLQSMMTIDRTLHHLYEYMCTFSNPR